MSTDGEGIDSDFEMSRNFEQAFDSNQNSESDSEQETSSNNQIQQNIPKRNKRKNFKPRCSMNFSDSETPGALNLSEFSNNNNLKNVNRRKTLSTRKLVLESHFTPIDLSANREDDDDEMSSDSEMSEVGTPDMKIPSSFSISNLSKPHVPEYGIPSGSQGHGVVSQDMREYAVNTMRELLGIYGLNSEVAESITRQLPIAAFSSGKSTLAFLFPTKLS